MPHPTRRLVLLTPLALLLTAGATLAQVTATPIPADLIQQIGPQVSQLIKQNFPDPPVKVESTGEKMTGLVILERVYVAVIPDDRLTAKVIEEAGEKEVPIGYLGTKSATLQAKEGPIALDKLKVIDGGQYQFAAFHLSVRAKGDERQLLIYARDKKPLATVPLKKVTGASDPPVQVKLSNIDLDGKKTIDLTVNLAGTYEAHTVLGVLDF